MPQDELSIAFKKSDWEEIYYALESKVNAIERGYYGPEENPGEDEDWIEHIRELMAVIERKL
jgi:hypothetical protein